MDCCRLIQPGPMAQRYMQLARGRLFLPLPAVAGRNYHGGQRRGTYCPTGSRCWGQPVSGQLLPRPLGHGARPEKAAAVH